MLLDQLRLPYRLGLWIRSDVVSAKTPGLVIAERAVVKVPVLVTGVVVCDTTWVAAAGLLSIGQE